MKKKNLIIAFVLICIGGTTLYVFSPLYVFRTPKTATGFVNRGFSYHEKGEYDKAIADYTEAIRLNPNDNYAYTWRGRTYKQRGLSYDEKGEYDKAIADYNEYLKQYPNDNDVKEKLKIATRKEALILAIANYTEAIRLDPKNADAYFKRGYAYAYGFLFSELDPEWESLLFLFSDLSDENWDQAISDWEAAVRINPNHADAKKYLENTKELRGY